MNKIALVPLSRGALINSSSLVQTIPLFRDKNGVYLFADTISVMGDFGLAIKAVDKREGSKYKYQFHKAELFVDNKTKFNFQVPSYRKQVLRIQDFMILQLSLIHI